ncbi:uncharacterized protein L969DRAFT_45697 [Mixia osmundae IAM 14324]|uniref:uncharacterized protein n=1 Tax=Mixia osmundae (strain CBS 9802 / IAM 14324 / JCM 22182 / KY 12970) TaxID=764103 RepID=UPI0004A55800|nr:uncharacterized protein L969DRAFT_45697 [Mixia osmundae IAM 14324]KEI41431.1 hypothetical protein L969DRAFT_45697 [Mixia osmundae IAM 14324]
MSGENAPKEAKTGMTEDGKALGAPLEPLRSRGKCSDWADGETNAATASNQATLWEDDWDDDDIDDDFSKHLRHQLDASASKDAKMTA